MSLLKNKIEKNILKIEIVNDEYKRIKIHADKLGKTVKEYVLDCIKYNLNKEKEQKHLENMTSYINTSFLEVWDNDKDALYDKI